MAAVADFLAISVADVGAVSERRTDRLLDRTRSQGLPPFLAPDAGVNSGLMIAQYTQAAMVAENRRLAVPASTDTLPTSAMQEDHVSLGWSAARKLRVAVANLARILAVEVVAGGVGPRAAGAAAPAAGTGAAARLVVDAVGGPGPDAWLARASATVERLVTDGSLVAAGRALELGLNATRRPPRPIRSERPPSVGRREAQASVTTSSPYMPAVKCGGPPAASGGPLGSEPSGAVAAGSELGGAMISAGSAPIGMAQAMM